MGFAVTAVIAAMLVAPLGWLLWLVGAVVGLAFYFLPTIVAALRSSSRIGLVLLVNLFLGWSVIGWVVALVMAATFARRSPRF